ncbi:hypothetical protein Tco_1079587 [Tanacetum coccineum]|uniref:Uncharacterized protein n=1 Tax=Tanacetum coccineum TaxID=301880 RepID=A0ABQ5HTX3_9ASTR
MSPREDRTPKAKARQQSSPVHSQGGLTRPRSVGNSPICPLENVPQEWRSGWAKTGREGTPPLTKEQIEGHISAMKSIIKDHNKRNKANPIRLNFEIEDQDPNEDRIVKGKEIDDEDLSKPFKETLKTPFTRRIIEFSGPEYSMPTNIALYDGSTDPADHLNRGGLKSLSPNSIDEWWRLKRGLIHPLEYSTKKACYKEPHEITKIVRKANETLTAFKERWTVETRFIIGVPEVMKISSFMDSVKSPELAKRFARHETSTTPELFQLPEETTETVGTAREKTSERATIEILTRSETTSIREDTEITELHTPKGSKQTIRTGNRLRIGKAESLDERPEAKSGKETKQKPSSTEGN